MNIIPENERASCNYQENKPHYERKRCNCSPEPGRALLRCCSGHAGPLGTIDTSAVPITPIPVGSVSIDTRELCDPTVLLTATLQIVATGATLLGFRVIRCVDGCSQPVGSNYTFDTKSPGTFSFVFQFCDCSECCGCATYSIEIVSATLAAPGTLITSNLSALAVENSK